MTQTLWSGQIILSASFNHKKKQKHKLLLFFYGICQENVITNCSDPGPISQPPPPSVNHHPPRNTQIIRLIPICILYAPLPFSNISSEKTKIEIYLFLLLLYYLYRRHTKSNCYYYFVILFSSGIFFHLSCIGARRYICLRLLPICLFFVVVIMVHKRCVSYARMKISKSNLYLNIVSIDVVWLLEYAGRELCVCCMYNVYAVISKRHVFYMVYCYFPANF